MRGHRPPKAAKEEHQAVRQARQLDDGLKNDTSVAKDTRRIHQIRMLCEEISQDRGSIRHVNSIPYVSEPKRNHFTFAPPREESRFRDLPELPAEAEEEVQLRAALPFSYQFDDEWGLTIPLLDGDWTWDDEVSWLPSFSGVGVAIEGLSVSIPAVELETVSTYTLDLLDGHPFEFLLVTDTAVAQA